MYASFDECFRALLSDPELDDAGGGVITMDGGKFAYFLNYEGVPDEATEYLAVYPSAVAGRKWTVMFPGRDAATQAYRAFVTNPENGVLLPEGIS